MSTVVCPYCFEQFDSGDVHFLCRCRKERDAKYTNFWRGYSVPPQGHAIEPSRGFFAKMFSSDSTKCSDCGNKTFLKICPHCHNRIPNAMVAKRGKIISIVGARSSGKSNYIAVLINELRSHVRALGNIGVTAENVAEDKRLDTENRYYEDFYNPLYVDNHCVAQTATGDISSKVPMIFSVTSGRGETLHMVFYDTAGENFETQANIADNVKFINESDAVIFLVDTDCVPEVRRRLGKTGHVDTRFDAILSNLLTHFTDGDKALARSFFSKPTAVVFSKIDNILNNPRMFETASIPGMSITNNSSYLTGAPIRQEEFEANSAGLRGALELWGQTNFVNQLTHHFKNLKFFGVSALGSDPDRSKKINGELRPFRVLDPLVWILTQFNFLK